jgi:hypothetical protein
LLDPYWIGAVEKYTKRTSLKWLVALKKDDVSPAMERLEPEAALNFFEEGKYMKSGGVLGAVKNEPFYNPYILNPTRERLELHRRYFQHLLKLVPCYVINTGKEKRPKIIERLMTLPR